MPDNNSQNEDKDFQGDSIGEASDEKVIDVSYTEEDSVESKQEKSHDEIQETHIPTFSDVGTTNMYYQETIKSNKPKKKKSFTKFIIGTIIISLVGGGSIGASFAVVNSLLTENSGTATQEELPKTYTPSYVAPLTTNNSIADIASSVGPSVVSIKNNKTVTTWAGEFTQSGLGSGVIFDQDEEKIYIITNAHVVEGASTLVVTFLGNEKAPAMVMGADTITDIAVVAVNRTDIPEEVRGEVRPAALGDSSQLRVGDLAIAIGNPIDEAYNNTVTVGVISALNREISLTDQKLNLIQTDAAINPGNSGGALVGPTGEVIGINTIKLVDGTIEGMGFALPMNDVMPIVAELMEKGRIIRPSLGIQGQDLTEEIGDFYEIPVGILVVNVIPGSSAELAGMQPGDIILEFDSQKIATMNELKQMLLSKKVEDVVTVKIVRGSSKHTLEVKLQEMPKTFTQQ